MENLTLTGWVNTIREQFDCDKNMSLLKTWEWLLLIFCSYLKEILDIFIYTIFEKDGLHQLFVAVYPLNLKLFWILILKFGIGYIWLIYFSLRYNKTNTVLKIWVFWALTIFLPIISKLDSQYEILNSIAEILKLAIQCLFFIYFFALDKVHLDSFKLLIYDNLKIDENTGKIYIGPNSKVSIKKLKHLAIFVSTLILTSLVLIIIVTKFIQLFSVLQKSKGDSTNKPKNQQAIEDALKKNPFLIAVSTIIMAPIVEEWVYRRFFMKKGGFKWWTIPMSGFIFGLIHLREGEGFLTLIPYMIPGIVFASGMYISKNIWHSTIAHAFYNAMIMIQMLLTT